MEASARPPSYSDFAGKTICWSPRIKTYYGTDGRFTKHRGSETVTGTWRLGAVESENTVFLISNTGNGDRTEPVYMSEDGKYLIIAIGYVHKQGVKSMVHGKPC